MKITQRMQGQIAKLVDSMNVAGRKGYEEYRRGMMYARTTSALAAQGAKHGSTKMVALRYMATAAVEYRTAWTYASSLTVLLEGIGADNAYRFEDARGHYSLRSHWAAEGVEDLSYDGYTSLRNQRDAEPLDSNPLAMMAKRELDAHYQVKDERLPSRQAARA